MTPLLWPVWCAAILLSFSRTTTTSPGARSSSFRPVARPTMPPPVMATWTRDAIVSVRGARARGTTRRARGRPRDRHRGEGPPRDRPRARRVVPRARAPRTLTMASRVQVAITGGGIVGLATGLKLLERAPGLVVVVLEKESRIAAHQTGHNSGVIHSGLYYKPGSEKAKTCVEGRRLLVEFCEKHGVPYEICGKLVVATSESELPALAELERRAGENGLTGVRTLMPAEFRKIEPHAREAVLP